MRIALITPGFSASESDWCIPVLLGLARHLARDSDVHVFTLRYPHQPGSYMVYGAQVHALGGAARAGAARGPLLARGLAQVIAHGRKQQFDVVHGLWADEPGFLAVAAGRALGAPSVVSLMGGELARLPEAGYGGQLSRANRWLMAAALRYASCVTVGSTFLRRMAQHHVPDSRMATLPLGVDADLFHSEIMSAPSVLARGKFKLLHVASLVPVKDQAMLLRALARVVAQEPGAHLHIVGTGRLQADLERQAAALGIGEHVTWHGALPHERLPECYRSADLCVLTSFYESQGMVTLEAAACGRATVGTQVGFLPDLLPELTVPVGDDQALAGAIVGLLRDQARRDRLGADAGAQVQARYTLPRTVDTLIALYQRALY